MSAKKVSSDRRRSRPIEPKKMNSRSKYIAVAALVIVVIIASVLILLYANSGDNQPEVKNPVAVFDTSLGEFKVELFKDKVPKTCENFEKLVNDGFYDGMIFHRVMDDFMIQAGNTYPDGSTKESPYGNIDFESDSSLLHVDGAISMASTGWGVGGSAQFFICDGAQSGLDGGYAVFGVTISGIDVVRDIADEPHDSSYGSVGGGRPTSEDIIINSITIE
ncbi:MAG: peptidylprolyl isomerase [Candidatus Thermoplasmatota archaeon]|nr:peptidylprolyl isomerase [Candidatus Thermoplasmatota archaeon]